ncbi:hypothetical protein BC830DRAFT_1164745 [Chytriomyces sp. MP71]|nr:hypothetical protein BC830DRAFT_1164745 [Chytriomyces sp. MP71]
MASTAASIANLTKATLNTVTPRPPSQIDRRATADVPRRQTSYNQVTLQLQRHRRLSSAFLPPLPDSVTVTGTGGAGSGPGRPNITTNTTITTRRMVDMLTKDLLEKAATYEAMAASDTRLSFDLFKNGLLAEVDQKLYAPTSSSHMPRFSTGFNARTAAATVSRGRRSTGVRPPRHAGTVGAFGDKEGGPARNGKRATRKAHQVTALSGKEGRPASRGDASSPDDASRMERGGDFGDEEAQWSGGRRYHHRSQRYDDDGIIREEGRISAGARDEGAEGLGRSRGRRPSGTDTRLGADQHSPAQQPRDDDADADDGDDDDGDSYHSDAGDEGEYDSDYDEAEINDIVNEAMEDEQRGLPTILMNLELEQESFQREIQRTREASAVSAATHAQFLEDGITDLVETQRDHQMTAAIANQRLSLTVAETEMVMTESQRAHDKTELILAAALEGVKNAEIDGFCHLDEVVMRTMNVDLPHYAFHYELKNLSQLRYRESGLETEYEETLKSLRVARTDLQCTTDELELLMLSTQKIEKLVHDMLNDVLNLTNAITQRHILPTSILHQIHTLITALLTHAGDYGDPQPSAFRPSSATQQAQTAAALVLGALKLMAPTLAGIAKQAPLHTERYSRVTVAGGGAFESTLSMLHGAVSGVSLAHGSGSAVGVGAGGGLAASSTKLLGSSGSLAMGRPSSLEVRSRGPFSASSRNLKG